MAGYLTVDGSTYWGVYCGYTDPTIPSSDSDSELAVGYIVLIVILSVLVVTLVSILLAYKLYFHPHAKLSASPVQGQHYLGHNYNKQDLLDDTLLREDTFSSLKSRPFTP